MSLQGVDIEEFLARDWQRNPRLFRQALPHFDCPVDSGDLAGLACEETVESRLIHQQGDKWSLRDGPFTEADFASLPASGWTLLVQAVDQYLPEVAALLDHFSFIPRWRIDDIMVSVASDGGGVGPHFDHYDVFLIQGQGQRRWQVGQVCDDSTALRQDTPLHQIETFQTEHEWVLEPGDILYLPPKLAHWGSALGGDCITLSVGFRAPSHGALLGSWCDEICESLPDSLRFRDPQGSFASAGVLTDASIEEVRRILLEHLSDTSTVTDWFGRLMTEPKYDEFVQADLSPSQLLQQLQAGAILQIGLGTRCAVNEQGTLLFVDGHSYRLATDCQQLAKVLSASLPGSCLDPDPGSLSEAALSLLTQLFNNGSLFFYDESD